MGLVDAGQALRQTISIGYRSGTPIVEKYDLRMPKQGELDERTMYLLATM